MDTELINEIQYWSYYRIEKEINRLTRLYILYTRLIKEYDKETTNENINEFTKNFTILQDQVLFTLRQLRSDLNENNKLHLEMNETLYLGTYDLSVKMENKIVKYLSRVNRYNYTISKIFKYIKINVINECIKINERYNY